MTFGNALEAVQKGRKAARKGWNGKEQYIELAVQIHYSTFPGQEHFVFHEDIGSAAIVFVGTRGRQIGWLASQSDMLADDWYIIEDVKQ